jgi:hypothetical protein
MPKPLSPIEEMTAELNEQFLSRWEVLAKQAFVELKTGLTKIEFSEPISENIRHIKQDLEATQAILDNAEFDQKTKQRQFIAAMSKTQLHLDRLVKNKEFSEPQINLFFMSARRAYGNLTGFGLKLMLNDNPFISLFSDPSGRDRPEAAGVNRFVMQGVSKFSSALAESWLNDLKEEILPSFHTTILNLPNKTECSGTPNTNTNTNGANCLLEQKMGKQAFAISNQDTLISNPQDASPWLERQIYRIAFDQFYTHCAQLYQILKNVDEIASKEQSPEAVGLKREQLLNEMGMKELGTRESQKYLNDLATTLGYMSIEDLHQNFLLLHTKDGFEQYNLRKQIFVSHANNEALSVSEDPLEILKKISIAENETIQLKVNLPQYQNESCCYGEVVMSCGKDFVNGINSSQKAKNIAATLVQDYLSVDVIYPLIGLDEGGYFEENTRAFRNVFQIVADAAGKAINRGTPEFARNYADQMLKNQITNKLLTCMNDERYLQERRLKYISQNLDRTCFEIRKTETQKKIDAQLDLIDTVTMLDLNDVAIHNYAIRKQSFESGLRALAHINPDSVKEVLFQTEENRQLEIEYNRYKMALDYSALRKILNMSPEALRSFISNQQSNLGNIESKQAKIAELDQQRVAHQRSENSLAGRLLRFRDSFLGFFGFFTQSAKNRVQKNKEIMSELQAAQHELEITQITNDYRNKQIQNATQTLQSLNKFENLTETQLKDALLELIEQHKDDYRAITNTYENQSEDISDILVPLYNNYMLSSSELRAVSKILTKKLSDSQARKRFTTENFGDLNQIASYLEEAQAQTHQFENVLPIDEHEERRQVKDSLDALDKTITSIIKEENKRIEAEMLQTFTSKVQAHFKETDISLINDPFDFVIHQKLTTFNVPSGNIKPYIKAIEDEFTKALFSQKEKSDRRSLESLSLGLIKGYNSYPPPLKDHCAAILLKVRGLIDERYSLLSELEFNEQRGALEQLDADLIYHYESLKDAQKKAKSFEQSYSSWLRNPFGIITSQDSVNQAYTLVDIQLQYFIEFTRRYNAFLESYIKHAANDLNSLDKSSLQSHAQRLENLYPIIHSIKVDISNEATIDSIDNNHKKLIELLKVVERNHPESQLEIIQSNYEKLSKEIDYIDILSKQITQYMITHSEFDDDTFKHFTEVFDSIEHNLTAANQKNSSLQSKSKFTIEHSKLEQEFSQLIERLNQIRQNELVAFQFYHKINTGEANDVPFLSRRKQYGASLILAITKGKLALASRIIAKANNSSKSINIQYLSQALILAVEKGQMELVKAIFESRKDISFTNSDLLLALSTAIQNGHLEIATYFLFQSNLELDQDTAERLQTSLFTQNSTLAPVTRGFAQMLADNDGVYLDNIRECYAVQQGLLAHLKLENDPAEISRKVERTVAIRNQMTRFYINGNFDNPDRIKKHVDQWENEIDEQLDQYLNESPDIALPTSDIKSEIISSIESNHNYPELLFNLTKLNHQLKTTDPQQYYHIISECINYAAEKGNTGALRILLSFIEDPNRNSEFAFNALCQALDARHANAIQYLIEHKAYADHEGETHHRLAQIFHTALNDSSVLEDAFIRQALILALSHIPTSISATTVECIHHIAQSIPESNISRMKQGAWQRFVADTDAPIINDIRDIYVLCELAYRESLDAYLTIRNPFDNLLLDNELNNLDDSIISEYESKIALTEQSVDHQLSILADLKEKYIQYILKTTQPPIQNQARLNQQLAIWEKELGNVLATAKKEFNSDLESVKENIALYRQMQPKPHPLQFTLRGSESIDMKSIEKKSPKSPRSPRPKN